VSRKRLAAAALFKPDWMVEEEFREAARREPGEAAIVPRTSEGESPVAVEAVPPKLCRLRRCPGH
jgi:hypothetical protein